jgi:hypothetical protein
MATLHELSKVNDISILRTELQSRVILNNVSIEEYSCQRIVKYIHKLFTERLNIIYQNVPYSDFIQLGSQIAEFGIELKSLRDYHLKRNNQ